MANKTYEITADVTITVGLSGEVQARNYKQAERLFKSMVQNQLKFDYRDGNGASFYDDYMPQIQFDYVDAVAQDE